MLIFIYIFLCYTVFQTKIAFLVRDVLSNEIENGCDRNFRNSLLFYTICSVVVGGKHTFKNETLSLTFLDSIEAKYK